MSGNSGLSRTPRSRRLRVCRARIWATWAFYGCKLELVHVAAVTRTTTLPLDHRDTLDRIVNRIQIESGVLG